MSCLNKRSLLVAAKEPLQIETKPIHSAPPNGLVLKTHYAGICHSDVHLWEDELVINEKVKIKMSTNHTFPMVLGHEISGEVYSLGSEASKGVFKVGDKVVVYSSVGCKDCGVCKRGTENMCDHIAKHTYGCSDVEGGYQEYVCINTTADVIKVPNTIPMDLAAMLPCSALTAYNALCQCKPVLEEFLQCNGRSSLLVIGAGGLGQWAIRLAKAMMGDSVRVVCADISEERMATGREAGADDVVKWPIAAQLPEIIGASMKAGLGGFNAVIDLVNNPVTIGRSIHVISKGGVMVQVGLYGGTAVTLPLTFLPIKSISIRGAYTGTYKQLRELVDLVATLKLKSQPLTKVPLEDAFENLMQLKDGKIAGRAIIDFIGQ